MNDKQMDIKKSVKDIKLDFSVSVKQIITQEIRFDERCQALSRRVNYTR